jgi:hypothetical protein
MSRSARLPRVPVTVATTGLVLTAAGAVLAPHTASAATSATFPAAADASVREDMPDTTFGTATTLRSDGSPRAESYLRFQVSGLAAPVTKAVLQVYSTSTSDTGVAVRPVAGAWSETAATWSTRPTVGEIAAKSGPTREGQWASLDVTSLVRADGTVDVAITSTARTGRTFRSREAGSTAPRLLVETLAPAPAPIPGVASATVTAIADITVREDQAGTAFSTETLRVDGSPKAESYLRFPVPTLSGTVSRAELRVYSLSRSDTGVAVRPVSGAWSESTTWSSKPSVGAIAGRTGATREKQWATVDVTSLVRTGQALDVALTTGASSSRSFRSRESGATAPVLVVTTSGTSLPTPPAYPVVAAAGDIACDPASTYFNGGAGANGLCQQQATSDLLLDPQVAKVLVLGDAQYEDATLSGFRASYDPSWGRVKAKTRPAVGNHEYRQPGARDYFTYFGAAAGDPAKGYYSYDVDGWHIIALNSNCAIVSCTAGSVQEKWLRADLAANPAACTLAYWHHPRYSSGKHGNSSAVKPLYQALYDAGAEVVLAGHDHSYERFARQDASGVAEDRGLRSFVVGTGGKNHYPIATPKANSEVRDGDSHGVLKLTLRPDGYDWQFVEADTKAVRDSGSDVCR